MTDAANEVAPTVEIPVRTLAAFHALNLLDAAEEVIDDMNHKVDEVEAVCAATRARIALRRAERGR